MPEDIYVIYPEQSFVVEIFRGETVLQDCKDLVNRIWEDPAWHNNMRVIMDFRLSRLKLSYQDLLELTDFFIKSPLATKAAGALLVTTPQETALATIFGNKIQPYNQAAIFSTWDAAILFLQLSLPDPLPELGLI
jgi:hypothetical protein